MSPNFDRADNLFSRELIASIFDMIDLKSLSVSMQSNFGVIDISNLRTSTVSKNEVSDILFLHVSTALFFCFIDL